MTTSTLSIPDHITEDSDEYKNPLLLVPFPPLDNSTTNANDKEVDVLAFGQESGLIYLLPNKSNNLTKPRLIRQYDDPIKCIAISPDGLRVAVGIEDGTTQIYNYDDVEVDGGHHPFIPAHKLKDEDDDEDDIGFSQDVLTDDPENTIIFDGPRLSAPIRQMEFDPRCGKKKGYFLAIVSEDGDSPLVIADVSSDDTFEKLYLGEEAMKEHGGGGVRSVAYSWAGSNSAESGDVENKKMDKMLLSTLGMDGRLVTWDVSSTMNDPSLEWELCHTDVIDCVPKRDAGMGMGADAGDIACGMKWCTFTDGALSASGTNVLGCLALPGKTDVQFRMCPMWKKGKMAETGDCEEWVKKHQFVVEESGSGHKDTIVSMAFQPKNDGKQRQLVTGGRDGKLLLWEMTLKDDTSEPYCVSGALVGELPAERITATSGIPPVTSIVWLRDNGEDLIYAANADGTIIEVRSEGGKFKGMKGITDTVVQRKNANKPDVEEDEDVDELTNDVLATQPQGEDVAKNSRVIDDVDDEDDILEKDAMSAANSEKENAPGDKQGSKTDVTSASKDVSAFIDDEVEDNDDEIEYDDANAGIEMNKQDTSKAAEDADQPMAEHNDQPEEDFFPNHNDPVDLDHHDTRVTNAFPPLQPAFAPSSTPIGDSRRILCWNHVGVVTLREDPESQNNLVDIAFHETAGLVGGRRPITFTDNMGFIVGSLGEQGGMFASDLMEDEEEDDDAFDDEDFRGLGVMSEAARAAVKRSQRKKNRGEHSAKGSSIYFHRFETFGRSADKDWVVALPDGERVLGCASGSGWGAVITSQRFLRLFSIAGVQGPVIWIPGEPVTVVGRGRFVAVIYHRSASPMQDGTQLLGYSLIDGMLGTTVASGELSAISPGAALTWAGFTDLCALSVMDSDGMLSMLSRRPSSSDGPSCPMGDWMPFLDTMGLKKTMSDTYWPVEVHGGKLVCVLLRGGKEYPDAARRPVTTTLSLRMPMATGLTLKIGPLEEVSVRGNIALNQQKVLNDYMVAEGEGNINALEDEYMQMSAQVDKVTLKLFMQVVQAGKVERGLDLTRRLHLEQSYDIAIETADRLGSRKLSDRIEELKLQKFPEENFDDNASMESHSRGRTNSFDDFEERSHQQLMESPVHSRARPETAEEGVTTEEETPPRESVKRKLDDSAAFSSKRVNPFAKKRLESPAKGIISAKSPTKLKLNRESTFSSNSRKKLREGKQIV